MSNRTALVVDDSRSARFALRRHLEHLAYKVDTAESAEEAYAFLKSHQPEVIFLDHVMPGTDGFTALRHIKADPQTVTIPVIICSSNEGTEFCAEARAQGASDVLQKPPTPDQLSNVLQQLQQFAADLKKNAPPPVMSPPAAAASVPGRVTSLREPDVTIGQAVMTALRNTLGRPDAPAENPADAVAVLPPVMAAAPVVVPPAPPVAAAVPTPSPAPAAMPAIADSHAVPLALREQLESRLKKLTQDIYGQISEMRANLALLESRMHEPDEETEMMQGAVREGMQEMQQRMDAMEARMDQRFSELMSRVDGLLQAQEQHAWQQGQRIAQMDQHIEQQNQRFAQQDQRIEQVIESARSVASEEAHAASERTVMSAAARIADQLADSILKALGRK